MSWEVVDVDAQGLQFVEAVFRGEGSFSSLCRQYQISRPTGCLWLNPSASSAVSLPLWWDCRPHQSSGYLGL